MINAIRVGKSGLRANCKISNKQGGTLQCLFCSSYQDDNNVEGGNDKKKKKIEKPIDLKKQNKLIKLQKSRTEKGENAIFELLRSGPKQSKSEDLKKPMKPSEVHHTLYKDLTENFDDTTTNAAAINKEHKEPIQVVTGSKVVSKKSTKDLLKLLNEAAIELGGDVETTEKELLNAYNSVNVTKHGFGQAFGKKHFNQSSENLEMHEKKPYDILNVSRISYQVKLGIFTERVGQKPQEPNLKMWHKLNETTLQGLSMGPPKNYFEQLILWTYHGKLWHFPIDNEQGMDLERNTDFTEHVFLDEHLEPWCPKSGPLRHFMELVTVGLSKNPYLSVAQKKEHIFWYRDYFESKKKLLNEVGALDVVTEKESESN